MVECRSLTDLLDSATNGTTKPSSTMHPHFSGAKDSRVDKSPPRVSGAEAKGSNTTALFGQPGWGNSGTWHTANDTSGGGQSNVTDGSLSSATSSSRTLSSFGSSGSSGFGLGSAGEGTPRTGQPLFPHPPGDSKSTGPSSFGGFGSRSGSGLFARPSSTSGTRS